MLNDLIRRVSSRVIGRRQEIRLIVAALTAGRHILLEGPPGTSKSTILRAIAEASDPAWPYFFVTGNSELTGTKLLGHFDPARVLADGYKPSYFEDGPLTAAMSRGGLLHIEEFNRLPEETTNVFVTAISEGKVAIPGLRVVQALPRFRIVAAMNPYDDVAANRVSRALKDRFCSLKMDYQPREEEIGIVIANTDCQLSDLIELAVDVVFQTRDHPDIRFGSSIRGAIDMVLIAKKLLNTTNSRPLDDDELEESLFQVCLMALRDKIWVQETCDRSPEEIIRGIWDSLRARECRRKPEQGDSFAPSASGKKKARV